MINKIQVCLQREVKPDFKTALIMRVMKTNYSHALIRFNKKGINYIFESIGEGVIISQEKQNDTKHEYAHIFDIPLTVSLDYFYGYIQGNKGKEYSQSQLVGIALLQKLGLSKLRLPFWYNRRGKMICSELVAYVLEDCCSVKMLGEKDFVMPLDIEKKLRKNRGE